MNKRTLTILAYVLVALAASVGLWIASAYNYLLFHSLAEFLSIVVAGAMFTVAWNTRRISANGYLTFLGIAFLFIGVLDLVHTLAYKGMDILAVSSGSNHATQLWIASRFLEALSLLLAPVFLFRRVRPWFTLLAFALVATFLLLLVFPLESFPVCYSDGPNPALTPFKVDAEYVICAILLASLVVLWALRKRFSPNVLALMTCAIFLSILSELAFTRYVGVYDFFNRLGHLLKVFAFVLIYRATVVASLKDPYEGLFRDLRERERALALAKERSEIVSADLARSNKDLEQFAYVASHDLQEPLHIVISFLGLLEHRLGPRLDPECKQFLDYSVNGGKQMQQMIRDLLAYSRVGTAGMNPAPVPLRQPVDRVLDMFVHTIETTRASVVVSDLPTLSVDSAQFTQVFQNLLGNALKFRRPDVAPVISIGSRLEGLNWLLWIKDNGIGLEPNQSGRIFEIFQRLHPADQYPGSGIGLAICKKIVERHHGRIWVESELGSGSTFFISLPA